MPGLLFSYDGRIGVRQFWFGILASLAMSIGAAVFISLALLIPLFYFGVTPRSIEIATYAAAGLTGIVAIYMQLAVTVKRCHDRGRSGWWSLLTLIPIVGWVWMIVDLGILGGDAPKATPVPAP